MKISQIINENTDDFESYIKRIGKICENNNSKKSLQNFLNMKTLIHSTRRNNRVNYDDCGIIDIKLRKKPTNTPLLIHNKYDNLLKEKFNFPYRSASLFTYYEAIDSMPSPEKNVLYILPADDAVYATAGDNVKKDFFIRLYNISKSKLKEFYENILDDHNFDIDLNNSIELKLSLLNYKYANFESEEELLNEIDKQLKQYLDFSKYINLYKEEYLNPIYDFIDRDASTLKEYNDYSEINVTENPEIMIQDKKCVYINKNIFTNSIMNYAKETGKNIEEIFDDMKRWIG